MQAAGGSDDEIVLNGEPTRDAKILACIERMRIDFDIPPVKIVSDNNFPTAAGLASSAAGFAALVLGIDTEFGLDLSLAQRSDYARAASASAARSLVGGWAALTGPTWRVQDLAIDWPLEVVIAITQTGPKAVSSSAGMIASRASPYFRGWVDSAPADFEAALAAARTRNFAGLAAVCEHSCLKMHGLMLSTEPGLIYWQPATLAVMHRIRELREQGTAVFFSIDAGPQVKAVCTPDDAATVERALQSLPGVLQIRRVGLGGPAVATAGLTPA